MPDITPKRRVFFSFHYQRDIWRVNQVRNAGVVDAQAAAGWADASLWERARLSGDAAVKRLIDLGLEGTTVTVVLIGAETAQRRYVNYEVQKSIERRNGILGVRIHLLLDQFQRADPPGEEPVGLIAMGTPVYDYDRNSFGRWVQAAFEAS